MFHSWLWFILITEYLEPKRNKVECSAIWENDAKLIFRRWLTLHCSSKVQITSKSSNKNTFQKTSCPRKFPIKTWFGQSICETLISKVLDHSAQDSLGAPTKKNHSLTSNTSYSNIFAFVSYSWWKKSCTTWNVKNLAINGIFTTNLNWLTGFLNHQLCHCAVFFCTKPHPSPLSPRHLRAQTLPQTTVSVTGHFVEAPEQQLLGEVLRNPKTSERGIWEFLLVH